MDARTNIYEMDVEKKDQDTGFVDSKPICIYDMSPKKKKRSRTVKSQMRGLKRIMEECQRLSWFFWIPEEEDMREEQEDGLRTLKNSFDDQGNAVTMEEEWLTVVDCASSTTVAELMEGIKWEKNGRMNKFGEEKYNHHKVLYFYPAVVEEW